MKRYLKFVPCLALWLALPGDALAQNPTRVFNAPGGKKYEYYAGQYTQAQAWALASSKGGYAVVFETMAEHKMVVDFFGFQAIAPCHTGHYQEANGLEPQGGWRTVKGPSAPITKLFNSNGPDDGIKNKWGWMLEGSTLTGSYGPGPGKNEDAGVIWHDNNGLLEDVSVNHRGGVIVEYK